MEQYQVAEKHALVLTVATPGWNVVVRTAETLVKEFEGRAMKCEDETQIVPLTRKAQAVREYWETLVNRIDQQRYVQAGPAPEFVSEESY